MTESLIQKAIAADRVPDYVSTQTLSESRDRAAVITIICVSVLTLSIVSCRTYSRAFVIRRFGIDDSLALASLLLFVIFIALSLILIKIGSGRHYAYIQYVMPPATVRYSEVVDFAAHTVYTTNLLICRISGLAFYHRLCGAHDRFLLAMKTLMALFVAGYLPQIFLLIFHCQPLTGLWPYTWQTGYDDYSCLQWGLVYSVNSSVSLLCDILLFGIPLAMLKVLDMSKKRKIQMACITLPGILVIALSTTRLVLVVLGQWNPDQSWVYNPMLSVEVAEVGGTLIALSIPGLVPVIERCRKYLGEAKKKKKKRPTILSKRIRRITRRRRRRSDSNSMLMNMEEGQRLYYYHHQRFRGNGDGGNNNNGTEKDNNNNKDNSSNNKSKPDDNEEDNMTPIPPPPPPPPPPPRPLRPTHNIINNNSNYNHDKDGLETRSSSSAAAKAAAVPLSLRPSHAVLASSRECMAFSGPGPGPGPSEQQRLSDHHQHNNNNNNNNNNSHGGCGGGGRMYSTIDGTGILVHVDFNLEEEYRANNNNNNNNNTTTTTTTGGTR